MAGFRPRPIICSWRACQPGQSFDHDYGLGPDPLQQSLQPRRGQRHAAGEPLRIAAATATRLGARPLLEEIEALARRGRVELGDAAEGTAEDGLDLTEREREVLRLVAVGRTNREIGAELYMSPKTASVHVSRILRKLNVRGRVEAAAVAHRRGLE